MVRSIQVHVPREESIGVQTILSNHELVQRAKSFTSSDGEEVMISFVCADKHLSEVLQSLDNTGLGHEFGSIDIIALQSTIPMLDKATSSEGKRRKYNLTDRRTVREIEEAIHSGLHLTFDYILLICIAAIIAAVGLITDSAVIVVAAMLVSPLMGPILGVAFGIAVGRKDLVKLGLRNELWGVAICLILGAIVGALAILFFAPLGVPALTHMTGNKPLVSDEMTSRGQVLSLLSGFCLALPSGIGVALATTNAAVSALVGVAISSALLPPVINSSIAITMGIIYHFGHSEQNLDEIFWRVGFYSFLLFLVNFVTIIIFALLTFRIKGVTRENVELSFKGMIQAPLRGLQSTIHAIRGHHHPPMQELSTSVHVLPREVAEDRISPSREISY